MAHRFDVIVDGKLVTFTKFEDIPTQIDMLIAFVPEIPPEPHSKEQHDEIDAWVDKFNEVMERIICSEDLPQDLET
jgi:hypothetical protein